ncbi:MAG: HlyC/CorC family transporter [Chloroflexota bacterium]|nr:HlyC/CorC family transporter [Chloroflexota bacterium]
MILGLVLWGLLLLAAGAGSVLQTVAASVRDLQPTLLAAQTRRARWLDAVGVVLERVAFVAAPLLALVALGDYGMAALATLLSFVALLGMRFLGRRWAKKKIDRLVRLLFGEAAAFFPLAEPPATEPEEARDRRSSMDEQAIEQMVDAGEKAGLIESDEHEMITGILQLDRTLVREIMVPRIDVIALDAETTLPDALDVVIAGAHSRVPVYEGSIDHVIGLLYAKDLLKTLREGKIESSLGSLVRPAYFVPESKRLDELLQELQANKVHMAIVVDEYGGTAGIVTIEDVLEEIVGEIQDEYDTGEEPLIERVGENEGVFNARVNVNEVNQALGLDLPTESDTLGGLVYQRLEKMPKAGDQMRVGNVTVSVLSVIGRRIKKVRVTRIVEERGSGDHLDEEKAIQ